MSQNGNSDFFDEAREFLLSLEVFFDEEPSVAMLIFRCSLLKAIKFNLLRDGNQMAEEELLVSNIELEDEISRLRNDIKTKMHRLETIFCEAHDFQSIIEEADKE